MREPILVCLCRPSTGRGAEIAKTGQQNFMLLKLKPLRDEFLKVQTAGINIKHLLTTQAREMVVVLRAGDLVKNNSTRHVHGQELLVCDQRLQISVYGGYTYASTAPLGEVVNFLNRQRPAGLLEDLEDCLALLRVSFHI